MSKNIIDSAKLMVGGDTLTQAERTAIAQALIDFAEALEFYRDGDEQRPWAASIMADGGRLARATLQKWEVKL